MKPIPVKAVDDPCASLRRVLQQAFGRLDEAAARDGHQGKGPQTRAPLASLTVPADQERQGIGDPKVPQMGNDLKSIQARVSGCQNFRAHLHPD